MFSKAKGFKFYSARFILRKEESETKYRNKTRSFEVRSIFATRCLNKCEWYLTLLILLCERSSIVHRELWEEKAFAMSYSSVSDTKKSRMCETRNRGRKKILKHSFSRLPRTISQCTKKKSGCILLDIFKYRTIKESAKKIILMTEYWFGRQSSGLCLILGWQNSPLRKIDRFFVWRQEMLYYSVYCFAGEFCESESKS